MTDSPVNILLKQLIDFDKSISQPLYVQVSQQIINAIQRQYLPEGTMLPGTRVLGKLLKIHRNTAVAIYDELSSLGWVEIIPNKGTFILKPLQKKANIKAPSQKTNQVYKAPKTTGFPFQKAFHLASTIQLTDAKYTINDGKPDLRLHPVPQFIRWYSAAMKRKTLIQKWSKSDEISGTLFQTQLCNYLNATRGFHIAPNNLINTRSTEMSLYIVSQLLIKQNDIVLVGRLSNYASNMIFQQSGASIRTIPVDSEGLDVEYIKAHFIKGSIRCVYVSAHRDYPTTVRLSEKRRLALLELAKTYEFAIIEDDYDYDFQYEEVPMVPMASTDTKGVVIYLGKLGQSLFPSFQTGFVVAPENLILEAKNYLQLLDKQGDLIQEQILSELISEGEIYRLMKKNILVYKQRRDFLCEQLTKYFANKIDLFLPKIILYQDKKTCAIRFGFGHLNEDEIAPVIKKLKSAYNKVTIKRF